MSGLRAFSFYSIEFLYAESSRLSLGAFILPLLVALLLIYLLLRLAKKTTNQEFYKNRWFYILLLSAIPLLFIFARPFDGQVLGFDGKSYHPIMPMLASIPAVLAVGLAGPLAAFLTGTLIGIAQMLLFGQDLALMLYYPVLVLIFANQLNECNEDPSAPRVVVTKLFEAAMLGLPFWMAYQFGLAFSYGLRDVIAVLTQSIFLWIIHLPEVLMSAVALVLVLRFLKADWMPREFLNEPRQPTILGSAIGQIEALSLGDYERVYDLQPQTQAEKSLANAIEGLRRSLQVRTDNQERLLSLDPSHYSKEGYDLVMSSILKAALTRDASAARLILLEVNKLTGEPEMRLRIGQGEHTRTYAYLDVLILEKMPDEDVLVLSDIKNDQYFGLTPGTPYPRSILAFQLKAGDAIKGVLWVGFEQTHWFTNEEIDFYKELAFRASAALNTKEQILKEQTEKTWLNQVLNAIADPILVVDSDGQVLYENLAGQNVAVQANDLITSVGGQKTIPQMKMVELMQKHQSVNEKEKTISVGGLEYRVEVLPVKLDTQTMGTIVYLNDNRWITQANREKNEFVSNISHDLRSPLKLMVGYTRLIKHMGNLSDQQIHLVNRLESGIEDLKRLVSKVLDLDRLDNEAGLMYNTFDFKDVVNETIDMLEVQAQQKKISINTDFGSIKAPYISADRVLLQQAIYNLIENAIKFSPRGETVLIKAEKDASWMHLSIADHGKGIAPLDQSRIFNRFFHMDDEQNFENRGQGLGLSIVKSIVEKHGGNITVESRLGSGSIFYLDIPLHRLDGMKTLTKARD